MFKNYLTTALRNLWKRRAFSLINILGLSVGMTACFLIFLSPVTWWVMHRWLLDFAYWRNISVRDFLLAGFLAVFITLLTIGFKAINAATANPVRSLRAD